MTAGVQQLTGTTCEDSANTSRLDYLVPIKKLERRDYIIDIGSMGQVRVAN